MAKNSIRDFSATAGSNTDIQSVNIDENCPASGINNAIRELMVDLKNVSTGAVNLETPGADQLNVDNLRLDGNTISSTDTNGDITLDPNGTGKVAVPAAIEATTSTHANASVFKSTGTTQLFLQDTDATANDQFWGLQVSGGDFNILTCNDDRASGFLTPITIDSSGNVGIGSASPVSQLSLGGTSDLVFTQNGYGIAWGGNNGSPRIFGTSGGALTFKHGGGSTAMTINSSGNLLVGKTTPGSSQIGFEYEANNGATLMTRSQLTVAVINRLVTDGTLVSFRHDGASEGSISVSGSTVSYNGGHLSRWSQATDGNRIDGLVKGTVMTNLDQMAVWHHEAQSATYYEEGDELPEGVSVGDEKTPAIAAYDEDNEQLNCMAVSSVEGDANVAGVFVNWDDDDEDYTADMNIAMTGDMVIRIASGTTVARGDLLMSAGDGTAKPQDDDIVRSKTIAKVTSTTVSHTYDDGSYLVPCVLMAC